ncbi:EthD family reductase [Pararhizobium mangrovi]|uniref:EthD family reductase n=1 Tax=Pararhizobium mangrovi TaxID=2590452 RepID=A0A506UAW0_9HYPH|nr:EthD family reductase [Pararhizobium mangrovi]TPW30194.1 EthD family reductase [Pararhizobium mangrovi]
MNFCYLAFFEHAGNGPRTVSPDEIRRLETCLGGLAGLSKAHIYTPAEASDVYNDDGASPMLGLQLYFPSIETLEAAIGQGGALKALSESGDLPSIEGARSSQQAMVNRQFAVPDPRPAETTACSYVVHYPGPAADLNAWLTHYIDNHPPIMARFPGVRELEILTRLDWVDAMPWTRVDAIQRNRIMFDSPEALTEALHSPVREDMRADFGHFPAFEGGNFHYPMATRIIRPS